MNDPLFNPITIKGLEIKNRLIMPAMHLNMTKDQTVTPSMKAFYIARAKGGVGLITVGYATVDELSGMPTNIGIHHDDFISGLQELSACIKDNGAKSSIQLNHAGRYAYSFFLNGKQPVAPSAIPSKLTRETPQELTIEEIKSIIGKFGEAAKRAVLAGFDAVEILCGTGYLISQFLSPLTNHRTDEYGGDEQKRMRFGIEIIDQVRKTVGDDFPIFVRINGNEFMPGGSGRVQLQNFAKALEQHGADAICVNVGWHEARVPQIISEVPRAAYAYLAKSIKDVVQCPVIASHRINTASIARKLIINEKCDMVAMGRTLIADPDFPNKIQGNHKAPVVHCIACAQGCFDRLFLMQPITCLCNPKVGCEAEYPYQKASNPRKVMVVGAGAAGLSAAVAAADKGHMVTIYEQRNEIGGQLNLAGAIPGREEFMQLKHDLYSQVNYREIPLTLNKHITQEFIDSENPDVVIVATGADPIAVPIPGAELPHVMQAWDVIKGNVHVGKRVVIIGGGAVGVETALLLAEEGTLNADTIKFLLINNAETCDDLRKLALQGSKQITILEQKKKIGKDIGKSTKWAMQQLLHERGVIQMPHTKVIEITTEGIVIETENGVQSIAADSVILAIGAQPNNELCKQEAPHEVITIGDAQEIGDALKAIHEGFHAGYTIH